MSNLADATRLSPGERFCETAALLAAGVLRLRQRAAELANDADLRRRPPGASAATPEAPTRIKTLPGHTPEGMSVGPCPQVGSGWNVSFQAFRRQPAIEPGPGL